MPSLIKLTFCAQTDIGKVRKGNEDNFLALDLDSESFWSGIEVETIAPQIIQVGEKGVVLAVSDGMGGALAGEVASQMAVEIVSDFLHQLQAHEKYSQLKFYEQLRVAIEQANSAIHLESIVNPECKGMGATFTAVAISGEQAYFAQVGDSRAHLIRQDKITRITKDQSVVQQLIDLGQITEEEALTHPRRNYILQALGAAHEVEVVVNAVELCANDFLLLCSDGLSGKVAEAEMSQIVMQSADLPSACEQLINLANERGGEDNITILLVQIMGENLVVPEDDKLIRPEIIARAADSPTELLLEEAGLSPPTEDTAENLSPIETLEDLPAPPLETPPANLPDIKGTENKDNSMMKKKDLQESPGINGRKFVLVFIAVVLLASLGAVYWNIHFVGQRAVLQQRRQQENQELITNLRSRLEALQQSPKLSPELMTTLAQRLNEAAAMPATKYQEVGQACSEVENAIILIEQKK